MEKEKVEIYYGVIIYQDNNTISLSELSKDKKVIEYRYPNAKIVEVHIGEKV